MAAGNSGVVRRARRKLGAWFQDRVAESTHCRDCGVEVSPLDEYCQNCGQSNPAKVNLSPGLIASIVGAVVLVGAALTSVAIL